MSLLGATILTGIATAVLAVGAIVTAVLAYAAFRKQSSEVDLLRWQNERDADERRKAQAARIFIGAPNDPAGAVSPYIRNASDFPIYEARIWYTSPGVKPEPDTTGPVMPGEARNGNRAFADAESALRGTVLTFRDAAGEGWMRSPDGRLLVITTQDPDALKRAIDLFGRPRGPRSLFSRRPSLPMPRTSRRGRRAATCPSLSHVVVTPRAASGAR